MQAQQQRGAVQEESVEDENLGPQLVSRLEVLLQLEIVTLIMCVILIIMMSVSFLHG